jgi:hypothetical protein
MGRQSFERLDLPQIVDFLDVKEVGLHALDGNLFVILYRLRLQNL